METDNMDVGAQKKKGRLPVIIAVVLIVAALAAAGFFVVPRLIGIADEEADDFDEEDEDEMEEEIAAIISRAEKLAAENRLDRALARVREGLETYPDSEELREKEAEYSDALEAGSRGASVTMERSWDSGYESAVFTGLNAQGDAVWTYETKTYPVAQLDAVNEIGAHGGNYYLVENGSVVALKIADGSVLWVNDDFDGSASGSDFDDEGTLYLCGHLGPDLFIVDADGNTIHRSDSFDLEYLWPYSVAYQGTQVAITFGQTPSGEDEVVYVDLRDYSASIPERSEVSPVSMDRVSTVTASSYLDEAQYGFVHGPANAIDGDLSTAWVEDAAGQGEGESITIQLDGVCAVSGFTINAGYQKNADAYHNNSRPAGLRVTFSDGSSMDISLEDVNDQQIVTFGAPVDTSGVTFTILSVYAGSAYQDTAISEISLF